MRTVTTQHTVHPRHRHGHPIHRTVDVEYLFRLLQYTDSTTQNRTSQKRAFSEESVASNRPRKRFKKADITDGEKNRQADEDTDEVEFSLTPVYHHTLCIRYILDDDEQEEGKKLLKWLKKNGQQRDGWSTVVSGAKLASGSSSLYVYVDQPGTSLLEVPNIESTFNMEEHDFRRTRLRDPLVACAVLQEAGRAELSAGLVVHAESIEDGTLIALGLTLDVSVSLALPAVTEPILYTSKAATLEMEEAQRRALCYIFSPAVLRPVPLSHMDVATLYATLGPAPRLDPPSLEASCQPTRLLPTLLPFQRRSVAWLLSREHKAVDANFDLVNHTVDEELPLFWQEVSAKSVQGVDQKLYVNNVTGEVSVSRPSDADPLGGILAEEPGLGKTLESIALVLLNPAVGRNPSVKSWNADARIFMKEVKTTLIVTPTSLSQQWVDELKLHAPSLKVLVYEGWAKVKVPITESDLALAREERVKEVRKTNARGKRAELAAMKTGQSSSLAQKKGKSRDNAKTQEEPWDMDVDDAEESQAGQQEADEEDGLMDWCNYVNQFDVCITTYNVLQQDLGVARPPPDRPRRTIATYINIERSRSPLVMCEWYRVIMDEVQMVGGGKTEEMVSLIPRLSSFAVSGTPARSQIGDLIHVLNFLRIDAVTPRTWARLLKPGYSDQLVELFLRYAIRTMKASVKDELTIPKQTRYLVPIELGRVERHVYDQNLEKALLELGFDARGVAVAENWEVDTANLRSWLRKLRGICTHPQVGQLQNQADKLHKPGVLKTIGEVLESMKDQNWRNLMEDRRAKVQMMTVTAQLYQRHEKHRAHYQMTLEVLLKADQEANDLIRDVESAIAAHDQEGKRLKIEAATLVAEHEGDAEDGEGQRRDKGKGRAASEEEDDLPKNAAGEEHRVKRRALQHRLRECQITLHKVSFLKGDVYHVLGNAAEEVAAYEKADGLRRLLLRGTEETAEHAMAHLAESSEWLAEKELMIEVPYLGAGGIRSSALMEEVHEKIEELLNQQSALLFKWRAHLIKLLTMPLNSRGEDADGMEYGRSLETQGEAETYLQVYAALLADRREAMTAERTLLAAHDVREKKSRRTKAAKKAELALMDEEVMLAVGDLEPQPQDEARYSELNDQRKALLEDHNPERAIRSIMVELSRIAVGIVRKDDPEKIIATEAADQLRELLAEQGKLMEKLQADLNKLRKTFNERIQYFRQLQEVSDTVADIEWEGAVEEAIQSNAYDTSELDVKINTGKARQRYLDHLAKSQGEGNMDSEEESCILCKCDFDKGYITQCAHVFCEDCMKAWLTREKGKTCPVCRVAVHPDTMQRFALGDKSQNQAPPKPINNEPAPRSKRRIDYNIVDLDIFRDINTMEALGSYGSKIETLIRHLLYVQIVDPGAKSIVFSAWADSLLIIEHALKRNSIPCLRIDQSTKKENAVKKFKRDPSIQVLLLHGERENAGLNITCASRVFLVESVVHHAFEIQAIARIDRMGQTRPTEVFCYYAEDTVERNILDLAVRRGQSLYTKDKAAGTLTAGPITAPSKNGIDAPKKRAQKGDFVFKTEDMLAIFFPHLFEDIEFLIPSGDSGQSPERSGGSQPSQPIAGPSKLT